MRLSLFTSVAASLLLGALASDPCGLPNQPCCKRNFCSRDDTDCVDGTCVVTKPGEGVCIGKGTKRDEPCCGGFCAGKELSCSEGTCVDVNDEPVLDQSGFQPGQEGGKCIGEDQICTEDDEVILECVDGFCRAPEVVRDQSV